MSEATEAHSMMSFREMMEAQERDNSHPNGTYIALDPDKYSKAKLAAWVKSSNIANPLDSKEYHVTLIYSRAGCGKAAKYPIKLPITVKPTGFEIFDSQNGNKCLVLRLDNTELEKHHMAIRTKYGATHDYDEYAPHITLSYDYGTGAVPKDAPDFPITLDNMRVEALDPKWEGSTNE